MARVFETVRRLAHEIGEDDIIGEAAKIAFYLFLSLFPLAISALAVTGLIGGDAVFRWVMARISGTVPPDTAGYIARFVAEVTNHPRPGLLSISAVFTFWSAAGGITAIGEGLNKMYDLDESRPWWRRQVNALGLVLLMCAMFIAGGVAVMAGPLLARMVHTGNVNLGLVGTVLGFAFSFLVAVGTFFVLYYTLPNKNQKHCKGRVLAGAISGAAVWLLATAGFRFYAAHFASFGRTYGALAGVIVLMLWLQLTSAAILFGGEVAAVLEQNATTKSRERDRDRDGVYTGSMRHA